MRNLTSESRTFVNAGLREDLFLKLGRLIDLVIESH